MAFGIVNPTMHLKTKYIATFFETCDLLSWRMTKFLLKASSVDAMQVTTAH